MISSSVELCNISLTLLGAGQISSLSSGEENAVVCNLLYEPALDEALRMHDWNFAITRQQLAALTSDNYTDYDNKFQLPMDPYCLKVLALLNDDYEEEDEEEYLLEGRQIYTDLDDAYLKYIGRITEVSHWDSGFATFFSYYLATKIGYRITSDKQLVQTLEGKSLYFLQRAREQDSGEGTLRPLANDWWTDEK